MHANESARKFRPPKDTLLNLRKVFNYKKPEDPRRSELRRKALEKFAPCPVVPIYVEHWGNNLQFYPNFDLFSRFVGKEVTTIFLRKPNQVKTKKKSKNHPALRCRPWSNYWGDAVKLVGGYIPHIPHPRVSAPLSVPFHQIRNC